METLWTVRHGVHKVSIQKLVGGQTQIAVESPWGEKPLRNVKIIPTAIWEQWTSGHPKGKQWVTRAMKNMIAENESNALKGEDGGDHRQKFEDTMKVIWDQQKSEFKTDKKFRTLSEQSQFYMDMMKRAEEKKRGLVEDEELKREEFRRQYEELEQRIEEAEGKKRKDEDGNEVLVI